MWNLYVTSVMIFYAPSHKNKPSENYGLLFFDIFFNFNIIYTEKYFVYLGVNENEETMEFANMETRLANSQSSNTAESVLTAFANKIASS
jgi:hypothetical protein